MTYKICGYHLANSKSGLRSIQNFHHYLDKIIPTWVEIKSDGSLEEKSSDQEFKLLTGLKKKRSIMPLAQNYQLNSRVSNLLLNDSAARERAIENLILYLNKYGFGGVNIDLEGVKIGNQENYTGFIARMAAAFHQEGYRLGLSIPAKSENSKDSTWSGAYNYRLLGEIADEIMIMAYDYHWSGGPPGPIAPLSWVQDVIDFAIIEIPLEKIYLGISFYGYDWIIGSDSSAEGLSYYQIKKLIEKYNSRIEWDQDSQSPYLIYNKGSEQHEVWFENQESIRKKIQLIKEFQLAGAAFWRLGLEDEGVWEVIR